MLKFHNLSGSPASRDTDSQRLMGVGVAPTRQPITSPAERGARAETAGTKTAEGGRFSAQPSILGRWMCCTVLYFICARNLQGELHHRVMMT